jgi:hypothetical protein
MRWNEWKLLWRFDKIVDIPSLQVTVMTPWAFARILWYCNRREFQAWPSEYETSLVLGWRWPFAKKFREKKWAKIQPMPLAIYGGPMDEVYLARATKELLLVDASFPIERVTFTAANSDIRHIGPTVNVLLHQGPLCAHPFWIASCPQCARKALRLAINLKTKHEQAPWIDPHEDPVIGFRRREAEAKRLESIARRGTAGRDRAARGAIEAAKQC